MLISAVRTIVLFTAVVIVMRLMGKRQVGEMQPYELVIAILIAELAAIPMEDTDIPLLSGLIPIIILLIMHAFFAEVSMMSERARGLICGTPSIVIKEGKIVESELRRLRLNLSDLLEQLRNKNFPNLSDVDYAILETNGQLSVIPKPGKGPVTAEELGVAPRPGGLPITIILDGRLNLANLNLTGLSLTDVEGQARAQGLSDLSSMFFASVDTTGNIHFQEKGLPKR